MFGDTPPPTQLTLQKIGVPVAFKAKELVLSLKPIIHLHIRLLTANKIRWLKISLCPYMALAARSNRAGQTKFHMVLTERSWFKSQLTTPKYARSKT
jgi:hypothetical protein